MVNRQDLVDWFAKWFTILSVLVNAFFILVPMCMATVTPALSIWVLTFCSFIVNFGDRLLFAVYLYGNKSRKDAKSAFADLSKKERQQVLSTPLVSTSSKRTVLQYLICVIGTDITIFQAKQTVFYHLLMAAGYTHIAMPLATGIASFCIIAGLFNQFKALLDTYRLEQFRAYQACSTKSTQQSHSFWHQIKDMGTNALYVVMVKLPLFWLPALPFKLIKFVSGETAKPTSKKGAPNTTDAEKLRYFMAVRYLAVRVGDTKEMQQKVIEACVKHADLTLHESQIADTKTYEENGKAYQALVNEAYGWHCTHFDRIKFFKQAASLFVLTAVLSSAIIFSGIVILPWQLGMMSAVWLGVLLDIAQRSWVWHWGEASDQMGRVNAAASKAKSRGLLLRMPWPSLLVLLGLYAVGTIILNQCFLALPGYAMHGATSLSLAGCCSVLLMLPLLHAFVGHLDDYSKGEWPAWCDFNGVGTKINFLKALTGVAKSIIPMLYLWHGHTVLFVLYVLGATCQLIETVMFLDMYYNHDQRIKSYSLPLLLKNLRNKVFPSEATAPVNNTQVSCYWLLGYLPAWVSDCVGPKANFSSRLIALLRVCLVGLSVGALSVLLWQPICPMIIGGAIFIAMMDLPLHVYRTCSKVLCQSQLKPCLRWQYLANIIATLASNATRCSGSFCAALLFCNMLFVPFSLTAYMMAVLLTVLDLGQYFFNAVKSINFNYTRLKQSGQHVFAGVDFTQLQQAFKPGNKEPLNSAKLTPLFSPVAVVQESGSLAPRSPGCFCR